MTAPTQPGAPRLLSVGVAPTGGDVRMGSFDLPTAFEPVDTYDLFEAGLETVTGISLSGQVDQVFLSKHAEELEAWVRAGGRLLINGHVVLPYLSGLPVWRKLKYTGPTDLRIHTLHPHPVWEGVDPEDLLFRTGVPGNHSQEDYARLGVAGFYARGYYLRLPEGATVINGIGPLRAPVDFEFPLGEGRVLVHGGLDFVAMADAQRSTHVLLPNIQNWLGAAALIGATK